MADIFAPTNSTLSRLASSDAALVRAKSGLDAKKMQDIEAAAKDFEAVFISEMLSNAFNTVEVDPLFGGGEAEETWRGLMVDEYGKSIASVGGFGLSDAIKANMIEIQEAANK